MIYQEIISQVVRRLGYQSFAEVSKADVKYSIKWAESEISSEVQPTRAAAQISLSSATTEYNMPSDFSEPREIVIFDSDNNRLEHVELSYEEYARYSGGNSSTDEEELESDVNPATVVENARLNNRVLIAIDRRLDDMSVPRYIMFVKPQINGIAYVYYAPTSLTDPFTSLTSSPTMPENFHHYIIAGAVYYMAQIESANSRAKSDESRMRFFMSLATTSFNEFELRKNKMKAHINQNTGTGRIKPFVWYEDLGKYR